MHSPCIKVNIYELREEIMTQAFLKYGLQNERTVKLCQKLDRLIVAFQKKYINKFL